jgi:hypothetical protein
LIANQQTDFGGRESEFVFRLTDEGYELPRTAYVRGITPHLCLAREMWPRPRLGAARNGARIG